MNNKTSVAMVWCVTWFEIPVAMVPVRQGAPELAATAPEKVNPADRPAARRRQFGSLTSSQTGPSYLRLAWT